MVVYNPGVSGAAKNVASTIASDLQAKGYEVELACIKSVAAANTSNYGVVVIGGPIYGVTVSTSVRSYLKTLNPDQGTKIGVFSTKRGCGS